MCSGRGQYWPRRRSKKTLAVLGEDDHGEGRRRWMPGKSPQFNGGGGDAERRCGRRETTASASPCLTRSTARLTERILFAAHAVEAAVLHIHHLRGVVARRCDLRTAEIVPRAISARTFSSSPTRVTVKILIFPQGPGWPFTTGLAGAKSPPWHRARRFHLSQPVLRANFTEE